MVIPCIWLGTTHPCNPPQYVRWVYLHFFTICRPMYKHCFLPVLLVFVMKCLIKMPCSLPHNHYCCSLPSPVCLPYLFICTCLNSSPLLAHHHLCYVDVFTPCLPTFIFVMLLFIVFFFCFFLSVLKFHSFVLFLSLTAFLVTMLCIHSVENLRHCWDFLAPPSYSMPGELCPRH